MPTYLYDGARITDFVAGVTPITAVFLNELQDQLKAAIGPKEISLFPSGYNDGGSAAWNSWAFDKTTYKWDSKTEDSAILIVPIMLPVGSKIGSVEVVTASTAGATAGSCYLEIRPRGGGGGLAYEIFTAATGFPTAGVGFANARTDTVAIAGAWDGVIDADTSYYLKFTAPSNSSAQDAEIWDYRLLNVVLVD